MENSEDKPFDRSNPPVPEMRHANGRWVPGHKVAPGAGRPKGTTEVQRIAMSTKRLLLQCLLDGAPSAIALVNNALQKGNLKPFMELAKIVLPREIDLNVELQASLHSVIVQVASVKALEESRLEIEQARQRHLTGEVDGG